MDRIREIGENIKKSDFFKGSVLFDGSMAERTTMRTGGTALVIAEPEDAPSAAYAVWLSHKEHIPVFVLGGGSNTIAPDGQLKALVLSLSRINTISYNDGILTCGAGAKMTDIVDFCASHWLSGLESFSGLPGTAGGAAYMNARCYDKSISDVFAAANCLNVEKIHKSTVFNVADFTKIHHNDREEWSYKHSPFQTTGEIIMKVSFSVTECEHTVKSAERITALNAKYVHDRELKGHFRAPSAGSVFKNDRSIGKPSGVLVDEAGLKGLRIGGAQVAPWHGNFIINTGSATSADIAELVKAVQETVRQKTGFTLKPEIIFMENSENFIF